MKSEIKYKRLKVRLYDGRFMNFENVSIMIAHKNTVYAACSGGRPYVIKISDNKFASPLHLQHLSFSRMALHYKFYKDILWGVIVGSQYNGYDVIIMPFYHDLLTLDDAFYNRDISSDVSRKLSQCVHYMQMQGISGYDTEFYWSTAYHDVLLLDIGLPFTFGCTKSEMILRQMLFERYNLPGQCYVLGSCCPCEQLAEIKEINLDTVAMLIDNLKSTDRHISRLARVHAVDFWGRLGAAKAELFDTFLEEYMKLSEATLSTHQTIYIQTMQKSVYDNLKYATCHMYEVKSPVGITSHSIANADGHGYIIGNDISFDVDETV